MFFSRRAVLLMILFLMIRRPPRSTRRHTLSLHDALPISAARRADGGALAPLLRADLPDHPRRARRRRGGVAGRAARQAGARLLRPRLCPRLRPQPRRGHRATAPRRPRDTPAVPCGLREADDGNSPHAPHPFLPSAGP